MMTAARQRDRAWLAARDILLFVTHYIESAETPSPPLLEMIADYLSVEIDDIKKELIADLRANE